MLCGNFYQQKYSLNFARDIIGQRLMKSMLLRSLINILTFKADYTTSVNTAQAESALAYELQVSKEQQTIVSEELSVDLVEKQMAIQVEEQEIVRADKELTATTRLPADAGAFKTKTLAEGRRMQKLESAEAEGQKIRLLGAAEAAAIEAVCIQELINFRIHLLIIGYYQLLILNVGWESSSPGNGIKSSSL